MKFFRLLFAFSFFIIISAKANTIISSVNSPDKKIKVAFYLMDDKSLGYTVSYADEAILQYSKLGISCSDADFVKNLVIRKIDPIELISDQYTLIFGKKRDVKYRANKIVLHCFNIDKQAIDITFQVSNDGVAFRYYLPNPSGKSRQILSESTTYGFSEITKAWLQPMQVSKTGWKQTNPAYEEYFTQNVPVGTASSTTEGWIYPALLHCKQTWVVLTEAGIDGSYCATHLINGSRNGDYQIGFPEANEVFTGRGYLPESNISIYTPWRVIGIGSLKSIMESTLGTDVAPASKLKDVSYISPGRSSWSWINSKDDSIVYSEQKRYIDFAIKMNWKYCLVDADWDRKIGYEKMAELSAYAKENHVGIWLWYNSAGDWNTVEYTPKNKLLSAESRRAEFSRLQQMGIKGIKIDFFGGDGSSMMKYYIDILNDAAAYKLMVNFHGTTLPRGLERTYPNLMTAEAVRGFENITFRQADADKEAEHCATLPFTRNLFDPMDFTPMNLYKIPTKVVRKTTSSFELALSVLFLSGVQHYAESPAGMNHVPAYVQKFLKTLPDSWDEVKYIDGYPGKYIILARRSGTKWYIAGINGEQKNVDIKLHLKSISAKKFKLISDGNADLSFAEKALTSNQEIKISLKPAGGFVAFTE